jgi:hypothetical protein
MGADNVHPLRRTIKCITELDSVRGYLNRIKARPSGLLFAKIVDDSGPYPDVKAIINFKDHENIKATKNGRLVSHYMPTPEEQKAMADELATVALPQPVHFLFPESLPKEGEIADAYAQQKQKHRTVNEYKDNNFHYPTHVFPCGGRYREGAKGLIEYEMLQVRFPDDTPRGKHYKNYQLYEDGIWRQSEPEKLPLYNAHRIESGSIVYLHEGPKPGGLLQWMVDEAETGNNAAKGFLKAHPFGKELSNEVHVGWLGGVHSVDRIAIGPLLKASRIYIIADNDKEGKAVIPRISRALRFSMADVQSIEFTSDFKVAFDLADPFPEKLFKMVGEEGKKRRWYIGPSFTDLMNSANWMTVPVLDEDENETPPDPSKRGPKKVKYKIRKASEGEWTMVSLPSGVLYVEDKTGDAFIEGAFNKKVRAFSDVIKTSELLDKVRSECRGIGYHPGNDEKKISQPDGEGFVLNTWRAPKIVPDPEGDVTFWTDYLEHLFPVEWERNHVERMLASIICQRDIRYTYGLLLTSTMQGTRKTTITEVLRKLLGKNNVSTPTENDIISGYNDYIVRKEVISCPEIHEGGHSRAVYQKLKSCITDTSIRVSAKFVPGYQTDNMANVFSSSNHKNNAMIMDDEDRRFFVPEVTEKKNPELFKRFYERLATDGPGIILHRLQKVLEKEGPIMPGDEPPITTRKEEMLEESKDRWKTLVEDAVEYMTKKAKSYPSQDMVSDKELLNQITKQLSPADYGGGRFGVLKEAKIRNYVLEKGLMKVSKKRVTSEGNRKHYILGLTSACENEELKRDDVENAKFDFSDLQGF